jgi:apolipoprotein N-acyltransferase
MAPMGVSSQLGSGPQLSSQVTFLAIANATCQELWFPQQTQPLCSESSSILINALT